jgi:hypothetical protein
MKDPAPRRPKRFTPVFHPLSADEVKAERGKNLTKQQVYRIRKELKLVK